MLVAVGSNSGIHPSWKEARTSGVDCSTNKVVILVQQDHPHVGSEASRLLTGYPKITLFCLCPSNLTEPPQTTLQIPEQGLEFPLVSGIFFGG